MNNVVVIHIDDAMPAYDYVAAAWPETSLTSLRPGFTATLSSLRAYEYVSKPHAFLDALYRYRDVSRIVLLDLSLDAVASAVGPLLDAALNAATPHNHLTTMDARHVPPDQRFAYKLGYWLMLTSVAPLTLATASTKGSNRALDALRQHLPRYIAADVLTLGRALDPTTVSALAQHFQQTGCDRADDGAKLLAADFGDVSWPGNDIRLLQFICLHISLLHTDPIETLTKAEWAALRRAVWDWGQKNAKRRAFINHCFWAHHLDGGRVSEDRLMIDDQSLYKEVMAEIAAAVPRLDLTPHEYQRWSARGVPWRALCQFDGYGWDVSYSLGQISCCQNATDCCVQVDFEDGVLRSHQSPATDIHRMANCLWFNVPRVSFAFGQLCAGLCGRAKDLGRKASVSISVQFGDERVVIGYRQSFDDKTVPCLLPSLSLASGRVEKAFVALSGSGADFCSDGTSSFLDVTFRANMKREKSLGATWLVWWQK